MRWTFTANGRIDTPPTIHRGLCLFGTRSGWVYCLRADDGRLVWRLRAAPLDERIVAYGQIESPWPVPGSVLVVDDVAYFAAGRQPLADGGILVFAVEPADGQGSVWVQRLDSVPQKEFYGASGLEFDNFDLLHREGDAVAMSRWLFDRRTGQMTCKAKSGFAHLVTGGGGVMAPRGCWSYAPRNESEQVQERPFLQPLVVFRDNTLFGCSEDRHSVYRRDFNRPAGRTSTPSGSTSGRRRRRPRRAATSGRASGWPAGRHGPLPPPSGPAGQAADRRDGAHPGRPLRGRGQGRPGGGLAGGRQAHRPQRTAAPVWDGLAAAGGRLFVTTRDGRVLCLGGK